MRSSGPANVGSTAPTGLPTWTRAVVAVLAAGLLAACAVVPPQQVTDPLGLDSQQLALQFVAPTNLPAAAGVGAQAVAGDISTTFEFDDWDVDIPISPGTLTNDVSIKGASLAPVTEAEAPEQITLSDPVLTLQVWQGAATYGEAAADDKAQYVLEGASSITLTRGSCVIAGERCPYTYSGSDPAFGTIKLSGTPLGNLFNIATQAPSPNDGSVSLTVQGEPDTLAGKTLTITLSAGEGTVGF